MSTLSSRVLNVTSRADIFVKDINSNNQLSLHGASWVLPNLQMTIQYYNLLPVKIKWLNANCSKYLIQISNIVYVNFGSKIHYNCAVKYKFWNCNAIYTDLLKEAFV